MGSERVSFSGFCRFYWFNRFRSGSGGGRRVCLMLPDGRVAGVRSHKDLIAWQRAYELKLQVYDLIRTGSITRDLDLKDQLQASASAAPRLIAEGFGRYYPSDFSRYLRLANGELKERVESPLNPVNHRTQ